MFSNASNRSFDDRFIPNRKYSNVGLFHYKPPPDDNSKVKKDIFCMKSKQLNRYQELLQDTLKVYDCPIFSFSTQPKLFKKKIEKTCLKKQWPSVPRNRRMMWKRDIVLDWPNTQQYIDYNIIDWGSNGYIATIWDGGVYLWHSESSITTNQNDVSCTGINGLSVCWSHDSSHIAVAATDGGIEIYAFPSLKLFSQSNCYKRMAFETCRISAICWDRTDSFTISGCSQGMILVFAIKEEDSYCIRAHGGFRILKLEMNCNNKFICSSATDGMVRTWTWPKMEPRGEISYCTSVRALAFHPWHPSLLCVGGGFNDGSLSLWNIASYTEVAHHHPVRPSMVDCLAWNHNTGELVSSHYILASEEEGDLEELDSTIEGITKVLVLSGFEDVLDYVDEREGRIFYLMWDKTGSKLATASTNETLCIYNFLGSDSNKNKISKTKKSSVLSKCIR